MIPEGKYADIGDGLKLHYHEAGAGPTVVMLHGSGPGASGWSNFQRNVPEVAAAGFRLLVLDTLGYGYSSKPDDRDYTLDLVVGAVRRLLDGLGVDRCAVVGNSHGGAMAIKLALDEPARVERLILMAPGGLEERETYMKMEGIRAMVKAFLAPEGITREALRGVLALQLHDPGQLGDEIVDERYRIAVTQPRRVLSSMQVPLLAPELGRLACPVLALWGMNDRFCPVSGALTLAQNCRRARVTLLTECGHWVMVEKAAYFNRACIDFLRERGE
jgi:4,5:9,10-diseco-3-hydroxy-5,9,17-trioxoandrosta-1(10),2-diene-4-oate hydrolase